MLIKHNVESAKKIPSNAKLYFGKISKQVANKINNQLGINLENYNLSLKADSIKHILKHHSTSKEQLRGQVPITETDFALIPEIVSNYDSIEQSGESKQGKPSLTFTKQIGDTYYLVNYVSDKNHTLEVQTMYKQKKRTLPLWIIHLVLSKRPKRTVVRVLLMAIMIPQFHKIVKLHHYLIIVICKIVKIIHHQLKIIFQTIKSLNY